MILEPSSLLQSLTSRRNRHAVSTVRSQTSASQHSKTTRSRVLAVRYSLHPIHLPPTDEPAERGKHGGVTDNVQVAVAIDLLVERLVVVKSLGVVRFRGLGHEQFDEKRRTDRLGPFSVPKPPSFLFAPPSIFKLDSCNKHSHATLESERNELYPRSATQSLQFSIPIAKLLRRRHLMNAFVYRLHHPILRVKATFSHTNVIISKPRPYLSTTTGNKNSPSSTAAW